MKLLLYSHFFAPSVGGVESIVRSLATGLAELPAANGQAEFDITLVTQTAGGSFDDQSLPFRVVRQPGISRLRQLISETHLLHIAGPSIAPIVLGLLAHKPVVIEHHGFQTICPNGQLLIEPAQTPCPGHFMAGRYGHCLRCNSGQGRLASFRLWLFTFVRRFLSRRASANITPTDWLGTQLRLPRVTCVPHGLDVKAAPELPAISPAYPVIAFLGRLVTTKGVRLLFEAAQVLQKQNRIFELLIIGDGPERLSLAEYAEAAALSGHLRFAGRLSEAELDAALARTSILAVPSVGGEVFGLVVAENMLRGLPVVASDLGAFVEVLGSAGRTFKTGDARDLAAKLGELLDDPGLARTLGRAARERVLRVYSKSFMIEGHARVYRRLLNV